MNDMSNNESNPGEMWIVEHDDTKCALCTVCAKNCPTQAIRRDTEGDSLSLYYNASLCDGCASLGEATCEKNCPEKAIRRVPNTKIPKENTFTRFIKSEMVKCADCDEYFAPARRLEVIAKKGIKGHELERTLCPICRRSHLVVRLIEEVRAPGSHAEFRSATSIRRQAHKRREQERHTLK